MAFVFPVRGRPTSEVISKRISLTSLTILEQPSFGRKKESLGIQLGAFIWRVRRNPPPSKHGRTA